MLIHVRRNKVNEESGSELKTLKNIVKAIVNRASIRTDILSLNLKDVEYTGNLGLCEDLLITITLGLSVSMDKGSYYRVLKGSDYSPMSNDVEIVIELDPREGFDVTYRTHDAGSKSYSLTASGTYQEEYITEYPERASYSYLLSDDIEHDLLNAIYGAIEHGEKHKYYVNFGRNESSLRCTHESNQFTDDELHRVKISVTAFGDSRSISKTSVRMTSSASTLNFPDSPQGTQPYKVLAFGFVLGEATMFGNMIDYIEMEGVVDRFEKGRMYFKPKDNKVTLWFNDNVNTRDFQDKDTAKELSKLGIQILKNGEGVRVPCSEAFLEMYSTDDTFRRYIVSGISDSIEANESRRNMRQVRSMTYRESGRRAREVRIRRR